MPIPRRALPALPARSVRLLRFELLVAALLVACVPELAAAGIRGLPFSRVYSLEDVGFVPRGSRLGFDAYGRVAVIHDGVHAVLNDTAWLNLADTTTPNRAAILHVVQGPDGKTYYGSLGSWGRAELRPDGRLHAVSLVPPDPPAWTLGTTFADTLVTDEGVYFTSRAGVVFRDTQGATQFFPLSTSAAFRVGNRVYVSGFGVPLRHLDVAARAVRDIPSIILDGSSENVVERATALDEHRALLSILNGRLLVFDGTHATPWPGQTRNQLTGRVSAVHRLADGNIALAISERGVFVLTPEGELLSSLTIPQYHRVSEIASREPGVMWLITEDAVEKVLYDSGLTSFDQRLGLSLGWPLVASWNGRTFVASDGVLYEAVAATSSTAARFERLAAQPPSGAWSLAAWGRHLLVGNPSGLYALTDDHHLDPLPGIPGLTHLVMVAEGLCYAIGNTEIALLQWDGTRWTEPAPRIPGVRNPAIVHRAGRSAWIEMGGDGVARVSFREGRLHLLTVPNEAWTKSLWANIGMVGDTVVLSAARGQRRFFSERTGDWTSRPDLEHLLSRSTEWLARVRDDADGNLWATHNEGLVRFTPRDGGYEMDVISYDLINDRYPVVRVLPDGELWVAASRSLYHVEKRVGAGLRLPGRPVLVSLMDARRNTELLTAPPGSAPVLRLPYHRNSLTFRFFSGGYAWRRTPQYEFRLNPGEEWSQLDSGSLLRFPDLREGGYTLQVRLAGQAGAAGEPLTLPFEILPPWHRTAPAYLLYGVGALFVAWGVLRWSGHVTRRRERALQQLVRERTGQLEATMSKLNEETRASATLAERNRLAGEIHDSVQQGLSGAILQLDTTLTLPALTGQLRNRLNVIRNMVSYARQEVQHAVWDMESPLLEGNDLGEALRKLATFITSGAVTPRVEVTGDPVALPRAVTHHLLRIAQEATTNALRHAAPREIVIRLAYEADGVRLEIADDGAGFQPDTVLTQAGHFGLRGIRTRAKKLRGTLTITSAPGEGTALRVLVPTATPSHDHDAKARHSRPNQNPAG
jgi:signal transduction histidine kinase